MGELALNPHITEEELELYARACPAGVPTSADEPWIDAIENHLLICEQCRHRLQELDALEAALWREILAVIRRIAAALSKN